MGWVLRLFSALLVFQTDFPASEQIRSRLDVTQIWVLARALQLAVHYVFERVVRDDVVVGSLVLDGNGLLHQATLLELVAVDQRATEASLLVGRQVLSKIRVDLLRGLSWRDISGDGPLEEGIFVFIIRVCDIFASFGDRGAGAALAFPLAVARGVESGALLFRLQGPGELAVDEAVVHDSARRPMNGVGPAPDAGRILLVDQDGARSKHLGAFLVVRSATDVAKASLQRSLHDGHGIFGGVEEAVPGRLESRLGLHNGSRELMPLGGRGSARGDVGSCNGVVARHGYRGRLLVIDMGVDGVVEDGRV